MVKHPIKLPLLKASDSSRSRDHERKIKSEIYAVKEMSAVKMNQISEKTRSKFLLLVKQFGLNAHAQFYNEENYCFKCNLLYKPYPLQKKQIVDLVNLHSE
jgi:hypothetical protein